MCGDFCNCRTSHGIVFPGGTLSNESIDVQREVNSFDPDYPYLLRSSVDAVFCEGASSVAFCTHKDMEGTHELR